MKMLIFAVFALFLALSASAQVIQNPKSVEFDPSADHNAVLSDGVTPAVTGYRLEIYSVGAAAPFQTEDFGKPTPDPTTGKIAWDFSARVSGWPLPGGNYEARVTAYGPQGEGRSTPSNQFAFGTVPPPLPKKVGSVRVIVIL